MKSEVLKIGNAKLTKSIFQQIPDSKIIFDYNDDVIDTILGYVKNRNNTYLLSYEEGILYKILLHIPDHLGKHLNYHRPYFTDIPFLSYDGLI
ncbi:MAG: hypothetical protein NWP64_02115 [Maribacter sp.]|nr:hypothetical protein [Maribacter sp.]